MLSNLDFISFLKEKRNLNVIYVSGESGCLFTQEILDKVLLDTSRKYSATYINNLKTIGVDDNYYCCDEFGLINWFLKSNDIDYTYCDPRLLSELKPINGMPDISGLILYKKNRVGIYLGDDTVLECTNRCPYIIESNINSTNWASYYKLPYIEYIENNKFVEELIPMKVICNNGIYYHNNPSWCGLSTRSGIFNKDVIVNVIKDSDYQYGSYVGCKVKLNDGKIVYCDKKYLQKCGE